MNKLLTNITSKLPNKAYLWGANLIFLYVIWLGLYALTISQLPHTFRAVRFLNMLSILKVFGVPFLLLVLYKSIQERFENETKYLGILVITLALTFSIDLIKTYPEGLAMNFRGNSELFKTVVMISFAIPSLLLTWKWTRLPDSFKLNRRIAIFSFTAILTYLLAQSMSSVFLQETLFVSYALTPSFDSTEFQLLGLLNLGAKIGLNIALIMYFRKVYRSLIDDPVPNHRMGDK